MQAAELGQHRKLRSASNIADLPYSVRSMFFDLQLQAAELGQHRKLRNALNFRDRNAQTTASAGRRRDRGLMTEPPVTSSIAGVRWGNANCDRGRADPSNHTCTVCP